MPQVGEQKASFKNAKRNWTLLSLLTVLLLLTSVPFFGMGCSSKNMVQDEEAAEAASEDFPEDPEGDSSKAASRNQADQAPDELPDEGDSNEQASKEEEADEKEGLGKSLLSSLKDDLKSKPEVTSPKENLSEEGKALSSGSPFAQIPARESVRAPLSQEVAKKPVDEFVREESSVSQVVEVREEPFEVRGTLVNSYYFIRGEKTWQELAQKIYRDPSQAESLKALNLGVKLMTGAVIYYGSSVRVGEKVMKSFFEDFGMGTSSYTVQSGDTISKIAQQKLGSAKSWTELAGLNNQVKNIDLIRPGMVIRIPPSETDLEQSSTSMSEVAQKTTERLETPTEQPVGQPAEQVTESPPVEKPQEVVAAAEGITAPVNAESAPAQQDPPATEVASLDSQPQAVSATTGDQVRTPASAGTLMDQVTETVNGLPVHPGVLVGGLVALIGTAFVLRRRPE